MKNKCKVVLVALIALALLGGAAWSAMAQDGDGVVAAEAIPAVQAAVQAVNRSFPGIGQPDSFSYTFTEATTDSSLGCPLIEGFALERPLVPYRIVLSYGERQFTYHASGDGTIVFPCDAALPIGGPLPPGREPFTPTTPAEAVIIAFLRTFPERGFPERYTFTFSAATTDSSLSCPLIEGFELERPVVPYRVVLFYADRQYTYHASGDGTIVFPCDEALPIGGPLPPGREPFTPATPVEAAINAFVNAFPERGFPERFEFVIPEAVSDDSLVPCPSAVGGMVDASMLPYRVTLYSASAAYVYHVSADSSTVIACDL
ncbi:MAG TPA: hypothetical protein VF177_10315 [Anaerolineae bacterium]